jgi:hypothetical protein
MMRFGCLSVTVSLLGELVVGRASPDSNWQPCIMQAAALQPQCRQDPSSPYEELAVGLTEVGSSIARGEVQKLPVHCEDHPFVGMILYTGNY